MIDRVTAPVRTAPPGPWPAPTPHVPLDALVPLPGSKSVTNRALLLAALATGTSVVRRPLRSRDTELMAAALRGLGATVVDDPDGSWRVTGTDGGVSGEVSRDVDIDVGNAGTVARFVPPLATLVRGRVRLDGDPRVRERPLGPLLEALRHLGARLDRVDALPVVIDGQGGLPGGKVSIDASLSSQFVSGLLLSGARFDEGVTVRHQGPPMPSAPHVAMTVEALREVGAVVDDSVPGTWSVQPGVLNPRDAAVEPDLSTAAAYLAAPLVVGGSVTVPDWPTSSTQAGAVLPDLLARMGGRVRRTAAGLTVSAGDRLVGLEADLHDVGELTPVLVALAALAGSPSRLTGIAHLRLHETNRLEALATELNRIGGDVRELPDGLEIRPRPLTGGVLASYDDHRMAMAWAVLGLAVDGVLIEDVATTRKTVPDFVGSWTAMLGGA
ncbi:MAG: 3-phosphoshikimate 1-carboxyvinyltransferase [Frankiales bacterium]|nr:3-phosphoshikimate 1-carboxyvinyltransferase [Frankiales bacterium]